MPMREVTPAGSRLRARGDIPCDQDALLREHRRRLACDREEGIGRGESAAPFVYRPDVTPQRRVAPMDVLPDLLPPAGAVPQQAPQPYGTDALTAALRDLNANVKALYQQQRVSYRAALLNMIGNPNTPPTDFQPIVAGNAIGVAYQALHTNSREYPVGFDVLVIWATVGASIRLSLSNAETGWYADISNGGPAGGYGSQRIWLAPQEIVYVRDIGGGGSALTANDLIHPRVCDPNKLLQDSAWRQDMGWTLGERR